MPMSNEMKDAITEFKKIKPSDCLIDHKQDKPIYTLIKIVGWPSVVHYEFRYNQLWGLFVELHIENKIYEDLGDTFQRLANEINVVDGYKVTFSSGGANNPGPNRKRWPSLSISLGPGILGSKSAVIMNGLINATRPAVTSALGKWTNDDG